MTQMLCSPVTVFSQTSSLTVGVGGEEGVGPTANLGNALSPVMKLALIAAPEAALYLPTVPLMTVGGDSKGQTGARGGHERGVRHKQGGAVGRQRECPGAVQPRDEIGVNRGSRGGAVFTNRVVTGVRHEEGGAIGRQREP